MIWLKKANYVTKASEIEKKNDHNHYKYITTQECNKLTSKNFDAKLKQANLARKNDIANHKCKTPNKKLL